ncbi:MAG: hypothetical protein K9H15_06580, partial [Bacteroidales bacterium]|nr:hypothetical protein [Bacteroidales bacterium]
CPLPAPFSIKKPCHPDEQFFTIVKNVRRDPLAFSTWIFEIGYWKLDICHSNIECPMIKSVIGIR